MVAALGRRFVPGHLLAQGDSRTFGINADAGATWPELLRASGLVNAPFRLHNVGQQSAYSGGGLTAGNAHLDIAANWATQVSTLYHPLAPWNIVVEWAGINDFYGSIVPPSPRTAAAVYADFVAKAAAAVAAGMRYVPCTEIDASSGNALQASVSALIKANASAGAWSAVADLYADPLLGAPGANASATYFSGDHLHLTGHTPISTPSGYGHVAVAVAPAVNARIAA